MVISCKMCLRDDEFHQLHRKVMIHILRGRYLECTVLFPFLIRDTGAGNGTFSVMFFLSSLEDVAPIILARSVNFFKLVRIPSIIRNSSRSNVNFDIVSARIKQCIRPLSFIVFGLDLWNGIVWILYYQNISILINRTFIIEPTVHFHWTYCMYW